MFQWLKTAKSIRLLDIKKHTELNSCTPNVRKQC
ncbi:TPA: hypothetical protein ACK0X5_000257 [Staphylococcus aureus]